jgi:uncharacterized membrane protein YphA (DoxX/SURF4 family)
VLERQGTVFEGAENDVGMAITMPVASVVRAAVTFLYNLILHISASVDRDTTFRLAIILGIVLPLTRTRGGEPPA